MFYIYNLFYFNRNLIQKQQIGEQMEAYVERIKASAEHLVKDIFPTKALELDTVINVDS